MKIFFKNIWKKIDNLHVDILLYAFIVSLIVFVLFLPFSLKEAFNMLFFGFFCLFFYFLLKENNKLIKIFDDSIF